MRARGDAGKETKQEKRHNGDLKGTAAPPTGDTSSRIYRSSLSSAAAAAVRARSEDPGAEPREFRGVSTSVFTHR